jgi:hypothetical protein
MSRARSWIWECGVAFCGRNGALAPKYDEHNARLSNTRKKRCLTTAGFADKLGLFGVNPSYKKRYF